MQFKNIITYKPTLYVGLKKIEHKNHIKQKSFTISNEALSKLFFYSYCFPYSSVVNLLNI